MARRAAATGGQGGNGNGRVGRMVGPHLDDTRSRREGIMSIVFRLAAGGGCKWRWIMDLWSLPSNFCTRWARANSISLMDHKQCWETAGKNTTLLCFLVFEGMHKHRFLEGGFGVARHPFACGGRGHPPAHWYPAVDHPPDCGGHARADQAACRLYHVLPDPPERGGHVSL